MKLDASFPLAQYYSKAVVRKNPGSEDLKLEFGETLELEAFGKEGSEKFVEFIGNIKLDGPLKDIDITINLNNALENDEALPTIDAFDLSAIKIENPVSELTIVHNPLPLVIQNVLMEKMSTSKIDKLGEQSGKLDATGDQIKYAIAGNATGERADDSNQKLQIDLQSQNLRAEASDQKVLKVMQSQISGTEFADQNTRKMSQSQITGAEIADQKARKMMQSQIPGAEITDQKAQKISQSQIPGAVVSRQTGLDNISKQDELKDNLLRVQAGDAKTGKNDIDPGIARNIRTAGEASANSNPAVSPASGDLNASPKITNAIKNVQINAALRQGKSVSAQNTVTIKNENEVKIGEVKLERIAPANFNQLIIESISKNAKISPVPTNTFMPGQVSAQLHKTLTIQLLPDNLGVVEVKISNTNGRLSISVETSTQVAEKILKVEISALADKLMLSGISSDEMTVRNNPNLEFVRDGNTQERQGGGNLNQSANGELAQNQDNGFQQQLQERDTAKSASAAGMDKQITEPDGKSTQRDGIYL